MATYTFGFDSFQTVYKKSEIHHADNDYLSIVAIVDNPTTHDRRHYTKTLRVGGVIDSGDFIHGPYATDPFVVGDDQLLTVAYSIVNLGSSDVVDQFNEAVATTDSVTKIALPIAGAAVGIFLGNPAAGAELGAKIAEGVKQVGDVLSEIYGVLGPDNCNGDVLKDILFYSPDQLRRAANQLATRDYEGPSKDGCGHAPVTNATFVIRAINEFQEDWRFCDKCFSLFFDGDPYNKGVCPGGGAHNAQGLHMHLLHDAPGPGQQDWRFCKNCYSLFFDGDQHHKGGICPKGGTHDRQGFNFTLLHDAPGAGQPDWRFCNKCFNLFYAGGDHQGHCQAGGAHDGQGSYNFRLAFH